MIATVGSVIVDLAVTTPRIPLRGENILGREFKMGPGGKGANASAALARLGSDSILVGSVGNDDFGRMELAALEAEGVRIDGVRIDPDAQTGIAIIMVDDEGENTILVALGANASLQPSDAENALARLWDDLDALLVNFEVPEPVVERVIDRAAERAIPVVLDAGPPRNYRRETWRRATIVSPNQLETEFLVGHKIEGEARLVESAKQILSAGPDAVVVKRGREGALICTREGVEACPAFPVETVDTTGAGDAFTAALTMGVARGMPLSEAVRYGSAAGALAVTRFGTLPAMPTASEVEAFLDSHGPQSR
jgi:ribokinase